MEREHQDTRPRRAQGLSPDFIHCPRDDLIVLIARMLNMLIRINDQIRNEGDDPSSSMISPSELTRFHSRTPPTISVYSYLARLARYSSLENAVLIAAVYYIDLLTNAFPAFTLNSLTVHRFILTATTVGSKGLCDSFCTNPHYAKVGGIQSTELDILEREFLSRVRFRVLPRDFNVQKCLEELKSSPTERRTSISTLEFPKSEDTAGQRRRSSLSLAGGEGEQETEKVDLRTVHLRANSGFNVLDMYYRKMVDLVGTQPALDDKELIESIHYTIDGRPTMGFGHPEGKAFVVNTSPDTVSDAQYLLQVNQLWRKYQETEFCRAQRRSEDPVDPHQIIIQHMSSNSYVNPPSEHLGTHSRSASSRGTDSSHRRVTIKVPTDNGSSNGSTSTSSNFPKSPLKRPVDPDPETDERSSKRSASTL